jgi:AcrR family transcriptional regulator
MSQVRRTQAARSQQSRDQIVTAALTVFALKGFSAASMDDVCMAAGCSKGGLYHHFPTKSAVLSGVVDRLTRFGALLPHTASTEASLPPQALGRMLIEIWTEAARDETLRLRLRAGYEEELDRSLRGAAQDDATLTTILRIGTLIQMLTRGEAVDAAEVARRLGIEEAA